MLGGTLLSRGGRRIGFGTGICFDNHPPPSCGGSVAVAGRADSAVAVAVRFISMSGCGLFSDVHCSSYFFCRWAGEVVHHFWP